MKKIIDFIINYRSREQQRKDLYKYCEIEYRNNPYGAYMMLRKKYDV